MAHTLTLSRDPPPSDMKLPLREGGLLAHPTTIHGAAILFYLGASSEMSL